MSRAAAALVLGLALLSAACSESIPQPDRDEMARSDLGALVEALEAYRAVHGEWPEGLDTLVRPDSEGRHFLKAGTAATYDPWGKAYLYEFEGDEYRLRTLGSDGAPGGSGADRDLDARDLVPAAGE